MYSPISSGDPVRTSRTQTLPPWSAFRENLNRRTNVVITHAFSSTSNMIAHLAWRLQLYLHTMHTVTLSKMETSIGYRPLFASLIRADLTFLAIGGPPDISTWAVSCRHTRYSSCPTSRSSLITSTSSPINISHHTTCRRRSEPALAGRLGFCCCLWRRCDPDPPPWLLRAV